MDFILTALIFVLLGLLSYWLVRTNKSNDLPRYRGLPVIGNLHQLLTGNSHLMFTEWSKDIGGIFGVQLLFDNFVVLNTYETIHEALVTKKHDFAGRPTTAYRIGMLSDGFQGVAFSNPNPTWTQLRRVCHRNLKLFDGRNLRNQQIVNEMTGEMMELFAAQKGAFDPRRIVYLTTMGIMIKLLIGKHCDDRHGEYKLLQALVNYEEQVLSAMSPTGEGVELDMFPWMRHFGNKTFKYLKYLCSLRDKLWDHMKEEYSTGGDQCKESLIGELLKAKDESDQLDDEKRKITDLNIKFVAIDMIMAGTSTTSNTLYSYFNIISHHPCIQENMFNEIKSVVGIKRAISLSDRSSLPYCHATILELLRFTTVNPFGLPRCAMKTTTIAGKNIPQGTQVLYNLWALHHDEAFWDSPDEFKPERFLDSDGQVLPASHPNQQHLMTFGGGQRKCIGEMFALGRLFLIITSTTQNFAISPGPKNTSCDPKKYKNGIILASDDYEITLQRR
ncbi:hypothetical protein CAPTEDRAFT_114418 [Capitella teleta]|uniref:Cytochrome P450 n=1 Tax=Capitella teleta TaxID=283909 RepID=R7UFT0_CAPTE|nr:hypothetical protein CAPTEDRAFT_114418 [Capitella teleta]|eukprot:ELU02658.1 hypothetical protein CAPTEDRAFT_114418 [Capitella teleta]